MKIHEFKVSIQAETKQEAKAILTAMFDIKKALSTEDLLVFAKTAKERPQLIRKARRFL